MNTKLVNSWFLDHDSRGFHPLIHDKKEVIKNVFNRAVMLFHNGWVDMNPNPIYDMIYESYLKVESSLRTERWVELTNNIYLDYEAGGYWKIEDNMSYIDGIDIDMALKDVSDKINSCINDQVNTWDLPNDYQLKKLSCLPSSPFKNLNGRPSYCSYYYCYDGSNNNIVIRNLDKGGWNSSYGKLRMFGMELIPKDEIKGIIPFLSSDCCKKDSLIKMIFLDILNRCFIPQVLEDNENYKYLIKLSSATQGVLSDNDEEISKLFYESLNKNIIKELLYEDNIRADVLPLNQKILHDTELGHWSLWQDELETDKNEEVTFSTPLVARDPKSSINDGIVAIDFGTKSTVVVNQRDNVNIHPMRIGTGDLSKEISAHHYENPTIMEFIDLDSFINAYVAKENKPYTHWKDLTISHTAQNSMQGSESSKFNTFLNEIKQWAGDKNRKLKIVCQQGKVIDLPPFLELSEDDFNPIEIYAYYLGLYINNINNGIYLDYILSFPVTYEMAVRDRIIASFEKGLKKSLPAELGKEFINRLTVTKGASEPAAYALTALEEYEFEPEGDERIFYGVFDFGGGTTDFDFGIFSEPTERKDRRFDYVIEHFGAGGDKFLGGENLLELLAFEIFKKNRKTLLENRIQFEKHPEQDVFAGSEQLLSNSQEARMNTRQLCIALRPFWEEHQDFSFDASGELSVTLTDLDGVQHSAFALDIDEQELNKILSDRIEKGVENFFDALRLAFSNSRLVLDDINRVNIFLAGNSSKSSFVESLFNKHISIQYEEMGVSESETRFELFPPLGADNDGIDRPTCKTGVAFGLIKAREGGSIKVIDHDIDGDDVRFKYYLGESRKNKFKPIIEREIAFNQWQVFTDAYYQKFEIFFTEQPSSSTGQVSITDNSIKKKTITINATDDEAMVYLRVVSPSAIEYVVANENDIDKSIYLCDIERLEF